MVLNQQSRCPSTAFMSAPMLDNTKHYLITTESRSHGALKVPLQPPRRKAVQLIWSALNQPGNWDSKLALAPKNSMTALLAHCSLVTTKPLWMEHQVRLNMAFYNNYQDNKVQGFSDRVATGNIEFTYHSISQVEVRGFDLELEFAATEALYLNGQYTAPYRKRAFKIFAGYKPAISTRPTQKLILPRCGDTLPRVHQSNTNGRTIEFGCLVRTLTTNVLL